MSPDPMKEAPMAPIPLVMITGTGDGDGGLTQGQIIKTPAGQPNLVAQLVSPLVALAVRSVYTYMTIFVGLIGAGMTPAGAAVLNPTAGDFFGMVIVCANLSVAGTLVGLAKDLLTIFGRLEAKFPLATGSV